MPNLRSEPPALPVDWSGKAIASVVLGFLGAATLWLVVGLLVAGAGAVLGHLARYDTTMQPLRGRRLAALGLLLSYGSILLFPVFLVLALSVPALGFWGRGEKSQGTAASEAKAARLFVACESYARANRGRYPETWDALAGRFLPPQELGDLLRSPHRGGPDTAFALVPHGRPILPALADSLVVIEENAPPNVPEIAVVYADGTVSTLPNPDHEDP